MVINISQIVIQASLPVLIIKNRLKRNKCTTMLILMALVFSSTVYGQTMSDREKRKQEKIGQEIKEKISRYKIEVRQSPYSVESLCHLADCYTEMFILTGKKDKKLTVIALNLALDARRKDHKSALPHISMAKIFTARDKRKSAIERAMWANRLEPENPEVKKMLKGLDITKQDADFFFGCEGFEDFLIEEEEASFVQDLLLLYEKYPGKMRIVAIFGGILLFMAIVISLYSLYKIIWFFLRLFIRIITFSFRRRKA